MKTFRIKSYSKKQKTTQKWTFWDFLFFFSRLLPFQFLTKTKLWPEYLDQRNKSKEIPVLNICEEITILIDSEDTEFRLLTTKVNTASACECLSKNFEQKNFRGKKHHFKDTKFFAILYQKLPFNCTRVYLIPSLLRFYALKPFNL